MKKVKLNPPERRVVCKRFVYGSVAVWRGARKGDDQRTHKWTAYVRGPNNEDISYFVQKVQFELHPSFEDQVKTVEKPPYEISENGWGEFEMKIRVFFGEPCAEGPVQVTHYLKLYSNSQASLLPQYGGSMRPSLHLQNAALRLPVVHEKCDELIFVDPVEEFYQILMAGSQLSTEQVKLVSVWQEIRNYGSQFSEDRELSRVEEVKSKLRAQIAQLADKHQQDEDTISRLLDQIDARDREHEPVGSPASSASPPPPSLSPA
eukprot:NODE_1168_length_1048_cov_242.856857_g804_i0.p1 GENE.NODE_1168_length_1048_cov_242.856857_g804_i0~~NODE_1168_length_1048_cov_242.856857_g804_i0.p1  ORF type:complete len:262 (-),score=74.04 NODE_1168_length_1048_cov_242.856857_g804_i0:89-874(-)